VVWCLHLTSNRNVFGIVTISPYKYMRERIFAGYGFFNPFRRQCWMPNVQCPTPASWLSASRLSGEEPSGQPPFTRLRSPASISNPPCTDVVDSMHPRCLQNCCDAAMILRATRNRQPTILPPISPQPTLHRGAIATPLPTVHRTKRITNNIKRMSIFRPSLIKEQSPGKRERPCAN